MIFLLLESGRNWIRSWNLRNQVYITLSIIFQWKDACLCLWILYIDAAQVTSTSRRSNHPVWLICAALPRQIRYSEESRIRWGFINLEDDHYFEALLVMMDQFKNVEKGVSIVILKIGLKRLWCPIILVLGLFVFYKKFTFLNRSSWRK